MKTLINGHEADINAIGDGNLTRSHQFRLRLKGHGPATLAHPAAKLGKQADGSHVITVDVLDDRPRAQVQADLLMTAWHVMPYPDLLDWLEPTQEGKCSIDGVYRHSIGAGKVIRAEIS